MHVRLEDLDLVAVEPEPEIFPEVTVVEHPAASAVVGEPDRYPGGVPGDHHLAMELRGAFVVRGGDAVGNAGRRAEGDVNDRATLLALKVDDDRALRVAEAVAVVRGDHPVRVVSDRRGQAGPESAPDILAEVACEDEFGAGVVLDVVAHLFSLLEPWTEGFGIEVASRVRGKEL